MRRFLVAGLLGLIALTVQQAAADPIADVENRAIGNRLAIKQWHIRFTYTSLKSGGFHKPPLAFESWVDGDRLRQDTTWAYEEKVPGVDDVGYTEIMAWSDRVVYRYGTRRYADGAKDAMTVTDRELAVKEYGGNSPLFDVRKIGMLPDGLAVGEIGEFLGSPKRTNLKMADESLSGVACKKITFSGFEDRGDVSYWIAPDKGCSVVRMEGDWGKGTPGNYRSITDLVVEPYKNTGIWFPAEAEYQRIKGGQVTIHERLKVEALSFNEPLDETIFTPIAMNVPAGTAVYKHPGSDMASFLWDGKEVRQERYADVLEKQVGDVGESPRRRSLLLSAVGLAVLSGLFLWGYFALRRGSRAG